MAEGGDGQSVKEKAEKIRELFLSKHKADVDNGVYDRRDVTKFENDDEYVASFKRAYENYQDACNHLHESLKFRLEFEVNDLTREMLPLWMWETGSAYFHNHDKDGHAILYLHVKQHKKDPQLLPIIKKGFAFLLETHVKEHPGERIVVLFDLAGAGLAQLDMEFIKYIINCFKQYYPTMLEYMLMYEMPWLFNAAWKLIKQMLHAESVKRIKFVTKSDIQEYINKDQLWEHMGGTDTFVYTFDPTMFDAEGGGEPDSDSAVRKRVTFADQDNQLYKSVSSDSMRDLEDVSKANGNANSNGIIRGRRGPPSSPTNRRVSREDNSFIGRLLTICPAEELVFEIEDHHKEASDMIILKNTLPYSIAYKVKTTSPEKYRVRPSSGLIKPGSEVEVIIHLQQGYQNTVHKDKFLIMAMEVANESNRTFSELWKAVQKDSIMEHRLRCVARNNQESGEATKGGHAGHTSQALSQLTKKVDTLVECNNSLQTKVKLLLICQAILMLLLVLLAIVTLYTWSRDGRAQVVDNLQGQCDRTGHSV